MYKKLLFVIVTMFIGFCYNINEVISYESELFPKIINIIENDHKKVAILYNDESVYVAQKLKNLINDNNYFLIHKDNFEPKNFKAVIFTYKNVDQNLINKLIKNKILILNIYSDAIKNSMISIFIGLKIKPYININLIKMANININPILLNIGEIYEK